MKKRLVERILVAEKDGKTIEVVDKVGLNLRNELRKRGYKVKVFYRLGKRAFDRLKMYGVNSFYDLPRAKLVRNEMLKNLGRDFVSFEEILKKKEE